MKKVEKGDEQPVKQIQNVLNQLDNKVFSMSSMLSEVETMDTLPFVKDTTPSREKSQDNKIPAPSIEEVDTNPEGLRALRGQGRYFGVGADEDGGIREAEPKCNNCSQRGHFKRNCPHVICTYCGSMDDHYSQHCPKAITCSNCNDGGHYRSQCPQKWKRVFCTLCNSKKHSRDRCPSIWRVYLLKDDSKNLKEKVLPMHKLYCYNCGGKGHFGDDCTGRRSSRVPNDDGSAFSGDNLSTNLKKQYQKNLKKQRREEYSSLRYDDFDYNDYEFDDALYDDPQVSSKSKSKKRKRSNLNTPPYQSNKRGKVVQPVQRGNTLPPARDRTHPLDFPRSNQNSSYSSSNMEHSRYGRASSNRNSNQSSNQGNYKNYNSYKPFRSGTLKR